MNPTLAPILKNLAWNNSSSPPVDTSNFQFKPNQVLTDDHIFRIVKLFKQHFFFCNLTNSEIEAIIIEFDYFTLKSSDCLYKPGDDILGFYILDTGRCQVETYNKNSLIIDEAKILGEYELIFR